MMDREDVLCSSAWRGKMCWQAEIWGEEGKKSENRKINTERDVTQEEERKEKYRRGYSRGWENRSDSGEAGRGRTLVFCDSWYLLQWARYGVGVVFFSPVEDNSSDGMCAWVPAGHLTAQGCMSWNMGRLHRTFSVLCYIYIYIYIYIYTHTQFER